MLDACATSFLLLSLAPAAYAVSAMSLSSRQYGAIEVTERVASSFSILGTLFVISTYLASSDFHKPINRLIFYASWGNMIANVATLVSRSGIRAGPNSALCQSQSFIVQMFMPADSLWTLAMAYNVYLKFFHHYSMGQLRSLEPTYLALCYGIPLVPAIIYLFVKDVARGKIYGPANLWCWISPKYEVLRIATFYGPVWVVLILTMAIYTITGRDIYQKRQSLREFSALSHIEEGKLSLPISRTTDVQITSQAALKFPQSLHHARGVRNFRFSDPPPSSQEHQPYTINIESPKPSRGSPSSGSYNTDIAAWAYTKVAMLFFAALLITWVPATVNRVYTFVHAGDLDFPLMYIEALVLPLQGFWNAVIYIATSMAPCRGLWRTLSRQRRRRPPGSVLAASETKSRNYIAMPEPTSTTEAVGTAERAGLAR